MQNIDSLIKFHSNIIQFKISVKVYSGLCSKYKTRYYSSKNKFSTMKRDLKTRSNINS
jgi:hypothetical protein